jgi:pimeloyl-ACP methyl ester carboxylesterase
MSPPPADPVVVLLHGLGRSPFAMKPLAWQLQRAGLRTLNIGYTAARRPLTETFADIVSRLDAALASAPGPVHFVTHSLGGILVRAYLAARPRPGARVVQLAPPNQGARLAETLRNVALARGILGQTLHDLGIEAADGAPRLRLPRLEEVELGVIAGGRGGPRGYGPWLPEDNDMVVCVRETWLPEARDWILVPRLHTFIMNAKDVHENVLTFLRDGRFTPTAARLARGEDGTVRVVGAS